MMSKDFYDIEDNEIRVVGTKHIMATESGDSPEPHGCGWLWLVAVLAVVGILLFLFFGRSPKTVQTEYTEAPVADTTQNVTIMATPEVKAYTRVELDTVNDMPLRKLIPVGAHVEMLVGMLPTDDRSIILAAQAADYRADNGQIAGAFVYRGELLSRGHPKYGFCAIIGDQLTMGMNRETPLFERAVEQEGYFFRQHSLVHDGKTGEILPKGKAVRRALCYLNEEIAVVESVERESMHDFAQALMDMGTQEAIGLVGNVVLPLYEDEGGNRVVMDIAHPEGAQETYIVWRR